MPFASLSAVLFTPALPELAARFSVSEGEIQATMTLFLFGYAWGCLPYGPLAKRWGRKPAIYGGLLVALLGTACILLAGARADFSLFLAGRFLSALGSSVGMKIAFTILGDAFEKEEMAKAVALLTIPFAMAPGVAVAVGGFLTTHYGWESCFYALGGYTFLLGALVWRMPETAPYLDQSALQVREIFGAYRRQLAQKKLLYAALMMGSASAIIYLFATRSPFLGITRLGLTPDRFGLWNLLPPLGLVGGSLLSHRLAARRGRLTLVRWGAWEMAGTIGVMGVLFFFLPLTPALLFLPMPLVYLGNSLVFTNISSFAMAEAEDKSNGAAVVSFLNMFLAATTVWVAERIPPLHPLVLPLAFLFFGIGILILQRAIRGAIQK